MIPDRGAGKDPEAMGLPFHHQGPILKLLQASLIETED